MMNGYLGIDDVQRLVATSLREYGAGPGTWSCRGRTLRILLGDRVMEIKLPKTNTGRE